jgi:hypothetical protein
MTIITRDGALRASALREPIDVDERIWLIAHDSFDDEDSDVFVADERFKLTRWPQLGLHSQTLNQMRMTAMLDLMFLSVHELALAADVVETEAQRLVRAFSLMGILQRSADRAVVSLSS